MPGIVEFPQVVREAVETYGDLFANEPERRHFAEYLTGLMIADRKTVSGINAEFAQTTDQSCLNRFLTEVEWDEQALNEKRLEELQKDSSTQYSDRGVIAIDDVLIDHDGQLIDDVGYFWDHAEQRAKIAHDYLFANYVCTERQALSAGIPPLQEAHPVRGHGRNVRGSHEVVLPVGRLGVRARHSRRLRLRQLLHECGELEPYPLEEGPF